MTKIDFSFGVAYRGDGSGILRHEQADGVRKICLRAGELFGGYSRFDLFGARKDPVVEAGCMISVLVDAEWGVKEAINVMVQCIKDSLQQNTVAVTRTEVWFDLL